MTHRAPIEIAAYDPAWPVRFDAERRDLLVLFAPERVRVEHVGSTAVPGLAAKPIIDLLLGAERLDVIESRIPALEARGYVYIPEHETALPERRYLAKPRSRPRLFHLHAVELGSAFFARHLRFRDFLRAHPESAAEYEALKRRLALRFGDDREGYTNAKQPFIESVVARAG